MLHSTSDKAASCMYICVRQDDKGDISSPLSSRQMSRESLGEISHQPANEATASEASTVSHVNDVNTVPRPIPPGLPAVGVNSDNLPKFSQIYVGFVPQIIHFDLDLVIAVFASQTITTCVETVHSPHSVPKSSLPLHLIPAVAKDIFVWIVGPRCSVNYFNCVV